MMVETVVALVSLQINALNVNVLVESLAMEIQVQQLEMVYAMMKPTMQTVTMMV